MNTDHAQYERADHVAAGNADHLLRFVTHQYGGLTNFETGHVDSPIGWVGLFLISRAVIAEYASTEGDPWVTEARNFPPGFYIIKINSDGLVWGHAYGYRENDAKADFSDLDREYEVWAGGQDL